jgi:hypothetical protein
MAERLVAAGMDMRVGVPSVIEGRQTRACSHSICEMRCPQKAWWQGARQGWWWCHQPATAESIGIQSVSTPTSRPWKHRRKEHLVRAGEKTGGPGFVDRGPPARGATTGCGAAAGPRRPTVPKAFAGSPPWSADAARMLPAGSGRSQTPGKPPLRTAPGARKNEKGRGGLRHHGPRGSNRSPPASGVDRCENDADWVWGKPRTFLGIRINALGLAPPTERGNRMFEVRCHQGGLGRCSRVAAAGGIRRQKSFRQTVGGP